MSTTVAGLKQYPIDKDGNTNQLTNLSNSPNSPGIPFRSPAKNAHAATLPKEDSYTVVDQPPGSNSMLDNIPVTPQQHVQEVNIPPTTPQQNFQEVLRELLSNHRGPPPNFKTPPTPQTTPIHVSVKSNLRSPPYLNLASLADNTLLRHIEASPSGLGLSIGDIIFTNLDENRKNNVNRSLSITFRDTANNTPAIRPDTSIGDQLSGLNPEQASTPVTHTIAVAPPPAHKRDVTNRDITAKVKINADVETIKTFSPIMSLRDSKTVVKINTDAKEKTTLSILNLEAMKLKEENDVIDTTLTRLHYLQLIPCLFLVGGFARMTPTSVNFFAGEDSFFELEYMICVPMVTLGFIAFDMMFYQHLYTRDKWSIENKYKECVASLPKEGTVVTSEQTNLEAIVSNVKEVNRLDNTRSMDIIHILNEDLIVQQLLIQANIDKNDLVKRYQDALRNRGDGKPPPDLMAMMEEASINVSRTNYSYSHEHLTWITNASEYLQSIRVPLRLASVMLLLHVVVAAKRDTLLTENEMLITVAVSCGVLFAAALYATYLELEKQTYKDKCDLEKRKNQRQAHDVLIATLGLNINRKLNDPNEIIRSDKPLPSHRWLQNPLNWGFSHAIYFKMLPSLLILGSLGRRPFTFYTFFSLSESSGENAIDSITAPYDTPDQDMAIVISFVMLATILDLTYMFFSLREEKWKLDRAADKECIQEHIKSKGLNLKDDHTVMTYEEEVMHQALSHTEKPASSEKFEDKYARWALIGALFDRSQFIKFGFRGMSLGFTMPRLFNETDALDTVHLDGMYVGMIVGAVIGIMMGQLIVQMNIIRGKKLGQTEKSLTELFTTWWDPAKAAQQKKNQVKEKSNNDELLDPLIFFYKQNTLITHSTGTHAAPK